MNENEILKQLEVGEDVDSDVLRELSNSKLTSDNFKLLVKRLLIVCHELDYSTQALDNVSIITQSGKLLALGQLVVWRVLTSRKCLTILNIAKNKQYADFLRDIGNTPLTPNFDNYLNRKENE